MKIDTVVVPAQEWGMNKVFLKQHRWYAVRISKDKMNLLKYIAVYEKKPIKSIRYMGKIGKIQPYKDTGKYEILLKDKPFKINPIKRSKENPKLAPQNAIYTTKKLIDKGEWLEDIVIRKAKKLLQPL